VCWVRVFLGKKKPNHKTKQQNELSSKRDKKIKSFYSGSVYPTSVAMDCVFASDDTYEGKNTASNNVRMLSSCVIQ